MELEEANVPLYESQKVNYLLKGVKNDDIQVQTTLGTIRDRYLNNFDEACLTLSRTVSSRFANIEPGRHKRSIGAVGSSAGGRSSGRGRGRGRHGGRGNSQAGRQKVIMNGIDVTDVTRSFTSDEWDKLRSCGGHAYVYQRREYLSGRGGREGRAGGRGGRGGRGGGRRANPGPVNDDRQVAAAAVTADIVEYDASNKRMELTLCRLQGKETRMADVLDHAVNIDSYPQRLPHWVDSSQFQPFGLAIVIDLSVPLTVKRL